MSDSGGLATAVEDESGETVVMELAAKEPGGSIPVDDLPFNGLNYIGTFLYDSNNTDSPSKQLYDYIEDDLLGVISNGDYLVINNDFTLDNEQDISNNGFCLLP